MADSVSITPGTGDSIAADEIAGVKHQRVKITIGADGTNDGDVSSSNPIPITGDITRVRNVVDGTISTVTTVGRVNNIVDGTLTTVTSLGTATRVDRVMNIVDGTLTTVTGVDRVRNLVNGTITTVGAVTNITNSISVYLSATAGTIGVDVGKMQQADYVTRVRNIVDGTLTTVTGVDRVRNVVDGTLSLVTMTQRVNNLVDGTIGIARFGSGSVVTPNSGIPAVNVYNTTSIFTVSGSTSGGTTSGVTLVAPSANYNFKVFAYSLQSTAIASSSWRFTNGAGSETELWRPLVTAVETTSTPKGANMAVQPPGFIFATGTNTTLALKSDTGSLVHYSVSYIKESA